MKSRLKTYMGLGVGASVAAAVALASTFAFADVAPTITTVVNNRSNVQVASAPIGTTVYAIAAIGQGSGTTTPTGTVDFRLYGNTSCAGASTTQSSVPLVNGVATSSTTVLTGTGLSYMVHYNGQTDVYSPLDGNCQPVNAQSTSTGIVLGLSTTTTMVGNSVTASSTLSGLAANATGTVAYSVYNDNACTTGLQNGGTFNVSNGAVSNSNAIQFNATGTFYFQGVYSGDQFNMMATSSCQGAVLTVLGTTTATSTATTTPGNGRISGTVYNDTDMDMIRDAGEAGLSGWTINLYKGAGWWGPDGENDPFMTVVSDSNGNYSFNNLPDGTYSIEEIAKNGWIQVSADYNSVVITNGAQLTGYDFGDVAKGNNSNGNGNGNDNGNGNGHGHGKDKDKKDNGNHYGWWFGNGNSDGNGRGGRGR